MSKILQPQNHSSARTRNEGLIISLKMEAACDEFIAAMRQHLLGILHGGSDRTLQRTQPQIKHRSYIHTVTHTPSLNVILYLDMFARALCSPLISFPWTRSPHR